MPARTREMAGAADPADRCGLCAQPEPATESTGESAARLIAVQVIHGETQRAFDVPWRPGLTVLDALRNLDRNGQLPLAFRGSECAGLCHGAGRRGKRGSGRRQLGL